MSRYSFSSSDYAVPEIEYQPYEDAWRGSAIGLSPLFGVDPDYKLQWGEWSQVKFDSRAPGIVKQVYVDAPESDWANTEGKWAIERNIVANLLGLDISAFNRPPEINPEAGDSLEKYGEPNIDVSINPILANGLFYVALGSPKKVIR